MNLTNPKTNESFDSPFADDDAAREALKAKLAKGDFKNPDFARKMAFAKTLTPAKRFWLHKLASDNPVVSRDPLAEIDDTEIRRLLTTAQAHLEHPAIVVPCSGQEVKLSLAGPASKHAGSVFITSTRFRGPYYGRITSGGLFPGRDQLPGLVELLETVACDPVGVLAEIGRTTGRCCYCKRKLDDPRSLAVGYGPTCAANYGLPY